MLNEIIYRGLLLHTDKCRYYQVVSGKVNSIYEDTTRSTLVLTYIPGTTNKELSGQLGIKMIHSETMEMIESGLPKRFVKVFFSLNGMKFEKLTHDSYTINIIIVGDSESRVVQTYNFTTIVVSEKDYKNPDFIKFILFSGNLVFIKPIGPIPANYEFRNFPKIIITDPVDLYSDSEEVFYLRKKYNDYVIRAVDYQDQFILELRRILENYGVELVRENKERTLNKTSYVTYQFISTPVKDNHSKISDQDRRVMQHRLPIEFSFRTTDMVLYFDFKNRYNNVDLLTNFCEFKTSDKNGQRWSAAIKWGQITEEFNHLYQPDDNSNFSNQCQFRCEIFFYEVLEDRYNFLEEIIYNINNCNEK